jgi:hypothetical protein
LPRRVVTMNMAKPKKTSSNNPPCPA